MYIRNEADSGLRMISLGNTLTSFKHQVCSFSCSPTPPSYPVTFLEPTNITSFLCILPWKFCICSCKS